MIITEKIYFCDTHLVGGEEVKAARVGVPVAMDGNIARIDLCEPCYVNLEDLWAAVRRRVIHDRDGWVRTPAVRVGSVIEAPYPCRCGTMGRLRHADLRSFTSGTRTWVWRRCNQCRTIFHARLIGNSNDPRFVEWQIIRSTMKIIRAPSRAGSEAVS